jgi:hypothetical protein
VAAGAAWAGGVNLAGCGAGVGLAAAGSDAPCCRRSRITSNSKSLNRLVNSAMRFPALTARTISQTASAVGTPSTSRTIIGIIESINCLTRSFGT